MKRRAPQIAWVILGLLALVSFCIDFENTAQGGAIDLRNRITGIRLLADGVDAYHYKWQYGESDQYCDPYNHPNLPVSKTTATPALLLLHWPLSVLPYRLGQFSWFLIQWLMLLGTGWLWLRLCTTSGQRLAVAAFIVGFTYTAAWRLHAERGQVYILYVLLLAAWLALTLDTKKDSRFLPGLLAGILITLRPPFALLIPFVALHRRNQLPGLGAGLLAGVVLPLILNGTCWTDYSRAMDDYSWIYRDAYKVPHSQQHYPATIEGIPTDLLANYAVIPYADFSIHVLLRILGLAPFPAFPPLAAGLLIFGLWLWLTRNLPLPDLLPGLVSSLFLIDLLLPSYRNNYNDVLVIDIIALAFMGMKRFPCAAWPCLLGLPLGWALYAFPPDASWPINLPSLCYTISAILFLFPFDAGKREHQARASYA